MKLNITVYSKNNCPLCTSAKQLLMTKSLPFTERNIDEGELKRASFMAQFPDVRQMPFIVINNQPVGGLAGLQAALKQLGI